MLRAGKRSVNARSRQRVLGRIEFMVALGVVLGGVRLFSGLNRPGFTGEFVVQ